MLRTLIFITTLLFTTSVFAQREVYIFTASWCGACQGLKNQVLPDKDVKNILSRYNRVVEVDIDKYKELSQKWNIKSIPTVIIADLNEDGTAKEINRWQPTSRSWLRNKADFENWLKQHLPLEKRLEISKNGYILGVRNAEILHNRWPKSFSDRYQYTPSSVRKGCN